MDSLLAPLSALFDGIFFTIITPLFTLLGTGLELLLLTPMRMLGLPPVAQVCLVALLTGSLSLGLRRLLKVEEKEQAFRKLFLAKKAQQEDLHLISDWKSREKFAKAIDDDIDEDFNTYLAGRFARYGLVYLLPMFLVLFWLEQFAGYASPLSLPMEPFGLATMPVLPVFLVAYILTLFGWFRLQKRGKRQPGRASQPAASV